MIETRCEIQEMYSVATTLHLVLEGASWPIEADHVSNGNHGAEKEKTLARYRTGIASSVTWSRDRHHLLRPRRRQRSAFSFLRDRPRSRLESA